ncbi:Sporulation related domain-containing protein [Chryseolinea serpens]|uniref:Sporulation related domain-containing protein n=1 Tax=Chryseolinea serpens TaxID=947013 RepID=A0A1M5P8P8_9BACT|nr:SPOR domain-containing protein [Chryseolinea serpens]SHG98156.1 Sporulation related domain-containing protein [Chryseolinea serpens]
MASLRYSVYILGLGLFVFGCATQRKTSTASTGGGKYTEDLSIYRPKPDQVPTTTTTGTTTTQTPDTRKPTAYVEPKYAVNKKVDVVLDSIDRYNLQGNAVDGFTIQIYSGLKREEALNAKKTLTSALPDLDADVQYAQPNFRVKVGKYISRLDAQKDFTEVKKRFPTAIIIPDKVAIN